MNAARRALVWNAIGIGSLAVTSALSFFLALRGERRGLLLVMAFACAALAVLGLYVVSTKRPYRMIACGMSGTFDSVTEALCKCGAPDRLAQDRRYPIVFESLVGEYVLASIDGRSCLCLYHCPWCGGRLPSKRGTLFTDPDASESANVAELLCGAESLHAVFEALGKPDRSTDCAGLDGSAVGEPGEKQQRSIHQYINRWTTLDLHVIEFDDGTISYAISGKYKGPRGPEQ